jgi:LysR family transcriptional regulator, regulator of gene expression of beta-lactamase
VPAPIFSHAGLDLTDVSLNALRAFEAAARHLSFTRAGMELAVTQAAVSHQVKALEARLGAPLFRRTARGLVLTDEGQALLPTLTEAFGRLSRVLGQFQGGQFREVLTVSVVGTFAVGWLLPRLAAFREAHPTTDLRLLTNNNRVDLAGESLDYAIRFGDGRWPLCEAELITPAPFAPLAAPALAARLRAPGDLADVPLLRSYRIDDWLMWFEAAGITGITARGPLFDSSCIMVEAAVLGEGVALAPPSMFTGEIEAGRIVQPFAIEADAGGYWLTRLRTRPVTRAMAAFRGWLADTAPAGHDGP